MSYPPQNWGFGSPGAGSGGAFGPGFGSPFDGDLPDLGFGDPSGGLFDDAVPLPPPGIAVADGVKWPDDGGEIFALSHDWVAMAGANPKFHIKIRNVNTGTQYPPGLGARGVGPGSPTEVAPELDGTTLRFILPPAPPGTYDVLVSYPNPGFAQTLVVSNALEIWFRHHAFEQWSTRRRLPPHFIGAGPRSLTTEPPLPEPDPQWPHRNLRAWSRQVAEECQLEAGRAVTRLTQDMADGATTVHVETTLGFAPKGRVYVDDRIILYTGRTKDTFTGCSGLFVYPPVAVTRGARVVADPFSWTPVE